MGRWRELTGGLMRDDFQLTFKKLSSAFSWTQRDSLWFLLDCLETWTALGRQSCEKSWSNEIDFKPR